MKSIVSKLTVVCLALLAQASAAMASPDLHVSQFQISPATPIVGEPVTVRMIVYNRGTERSGPFRVQWWPGENYAAPAQTWLIGGMNARGGRVLTFTYDGYPSRYARINTKVVVDSDCQVAESVEHNNVYRRQIRVVSGSSAGHGLPDLHVSRFRMFPSQPRRGEPVTVQVSVYNRGATRSGPFRVQWWPGENYSAPAQSWLIGGMNARGGRVLTHTYPGYPSSYNRINTRVVVDSASQVAESDEHNNDFHRAISVAR
jgi:subtilase family serine protease